MKRMTATITGPQSAGMSLARRYGLCFLLQQMTMKRGTERAAILKRILFPRDRQAMDADDAVEKPSRASSIHEGADATLLPGDVPWTVLGEEAAEVVHPARRSKPNDDQSTSPSRTSIEACRHSTGVRSFA
ncbi:hypothetical protein MUK42_03307 [Musa troglodytarum]|uniref:Uncharacterized protein n=1 Tax=Musa troglodytarum TaxID=320322 RepID=A0A9E7HFH3_9LILI|nr:hypothetical protein MUK42_03307 [Musa troglodytarum]